MANTIVLYSTGCPKCNVLATKLARKGIQYTESTSVDDMQRLGIAYAPVLSVNGELMEFSAAVKWVNEQ